MVLSFDVDEATYHLCNDPELLQYGLCHDDLGPATVVHCSSNDILSTPLADWLNNKVCQFCADDDVFTVGFLPIVYILSSSAAIETQVAKGNTLLVQGQTSRIHFINTKKPFVCEGPYYVQHGNLHRVARMYPDIQEAFVVATCPERYNPNIYHPLTRSNGYSNLIGVPSRLYYPRQPDKPLNGLRISVKDNIDICGLKTSLSSRSWHELYPAKTATAPCLQELLDMGAVVIGKSKLTQFAETEEPTADWVDYHCPFNPRGDGYLTPAGSTSGGGAALAAYPWLDLSIGTDTGGSLREPASMQGLFGIRPSFGSKNLQGIFPLSPHLDTVGFLTREVHLLNVVTNSWFGKTPHFRERKSRLLHLSDYEYSSEDARRLFHTLLSQLESFLGIKRQTENLEERWKHDNPTADRCSMDKYIGKSQTMKNIKSLDLWNNTQQFRDDYQKYKGKPPYVNPSIRQKWREASLSSPMSQHEALSRKKIFKRWFEKHVLCLDGKADDALTIIAFAQSETDPQYRDTYVSGPCKDGFEFHRNFISCLSGCPQVLVPIGQISYHSAISGSKEYLPILASIIGPIGSDSTLTQLVEDLLREKRLPQSVSTGSTAFQVR